MLINLNDTVKVKIKPIGFEILRNNHEAVLGDKIDLYPFNPPMVDEEGYSDMQLWQVAHEFGRAMCLGGECPIDTMIFVPSRNGESG